MSNLATYLSILIVCLELVIFMFSVAIAAVIRRLAFGSERRIAVANMVLKVAIASMVVLLVLALILQVSEL